MKRRTPPKRRSPAAASLRQHGRRVVPAKKGGRYIRKQKHKQEETYEN